MRTHLRSSCSVALTVLLGACGASSSTQVVSSWKDPTVPVRQYQKVLVVYMSSDNGVRRTAEDELARQIRNAVPSYSVLPEALLRDAEGAKAWVTREGYDGAVVMRLVAIDNETTYVPGSAYSVPVGYRSMWGYWGTGWGYAYDPGYIRQDQVVSVEANLYSVVDEKLIWSSRTRSVNPDSIRELVDDIVDETVHEMKKQNVIPG